MGRARGGERWARRNERLYIYQGISVALHYHLVLYVKVGTHTVVRAIQQEMLCETHMMDVLRSQFGIHCV